ncbi:MAG: ice-binding family protein, partial [Bacteroidota bacterium]|nr:ice-binding family protein [Bacteroidota bacterium]
VTVGGILAYTPVGCGSTYLTGPAAPSLGTTACYGIFSGNGQVTNAGVSNVTGNVGTNMGLTVGFSSLNVTGTIHTVPDGSTAACAADLLNVYTYLNTLPADIVLIYPAQFGNGLVLTPHTYLLNAATTFIDTLFLNAQGNQDAIFVIQINGALSTSTYATVALINGAQGKNVYWKIDGAVNINNFSAFKGTIIANNGAVSLKTGVVLEGRALTTSGAVNTTSINTAIPPGTCSVLPVSWLYFRGKAVQQTAVLEWSTTNEVNNGYFTIEKSNDGKTFTTLTTVKADVAATGNSIYSFTDQQPYSKSYYRLSQTDNNGHKSTFNTVEVTMTQTLKVVQYIAGNNIIITIAGATPGNGLLELYSADGKKLSDQKIILTRDPSMYKLVKPVQKGIYLLHIENGRENFYTGKVMVY